MPGAGPPTRRDIVRAALASALLASALPGLARAAPPRFVSYPFTLGVASGAPTPRGFTLWTRLAPAPFEPEGGMVPQAVDVVWEVADDDTFATVVASGRVTAWPEHAHSVRVDVTGLSPGRWYFYRFRAGGEASPIGRTRTAVPAGSPLDRLRFAIGSCQHYEHGFYAAHRHLAAENLDLMLFLGDYLYESSWGDEPVRRYVGGETVTLADYRIRHAQHRTDPDLQALHAAVPWAVTWDDHEVDNDWAAGQSEHLDPAFLERRAAAFQAYVEHMPLPARVRATPKGVRLYDTIVFGDLARFMVLDDRLYRTPQACPDPSKGGGSTVVAASACPELDREDRTLLGARQEAWLDRSFAASRQRWNVIAQQTLVSPFHEGSGPDRKVWTDGWDGYPAARRRLIGSITGRKLSNPIVVGGDVHATVIGDLHADPLDVESPIVASEVCGTSITSRGWPREESESQQRAHAHLRYVNGWQRGYCVLDLAADGAAVTARVVDEKNRDSAVETAGAFAIESGRPGVRRTA